MSAEIFLDTNVVVYAFDASAPAKQAKARELMKTADWLVSWQVVQEFANVALHRFAVPLTPGDLADYLELVLWPRCHVTPTAALYRSALTLHQQTQFRFYDSLVVASALAAGAGVLYSEDLQHGREIGPLRLENPFLSA